MALAANESGKNHLDKKGYFSDIFIPSDGDEWLEDHTIEREETPEGHVKFTVRRLSWKAPTTS